MIWYNKPMNQIKKTALINSLATALYIVLIGSFLYFGTMAKIGRNAILAPITMLFLFVFSAALTGFLMIGKPAQMYVDGKKKEALSLFAYTLAYFSIITFVAIFSLIVFTR
jgi:hypothetical protein